jgi:hypothetical protein
MHASGSVRIDLLKKDGIHSLDNDKKTHNFIVSRRILLRS